MLRRSTVIIISISFILFLIRLFICQQPYSADIFSYDFYVYTNLAKNIFKDFNFTAHWCLDNPIKYPPLFSVLIYFVTIFTKNSIVSIQYINAFSSSFCLVPLFLLVRDVLNKKLAVLAVIFMTCYYGIQRPCSDLFVDYLFSFLTITICWLTWRFPKTKRLAYFILLGILIGLAYLTKYMGGIYCLVSAVSIFCYFIRQHDGLKIGLRMISFLLLGFLPIFIIYQSIFYEGKYHGVSDIGTCTFFDGNYKYEKKLIYNLDSKGTEFELLSSHKNDSVLTFCVKHPRLVWNKYVNGFKRLPFLFGSQSANIYFVIQGVFLILLGFFMFHYQWYDSIVPIFLFVLTAMGIPVYYSDTRYLLPFMPLYFVLWLFIINGAWVFIETKVVNNRKFYQSSAFIIYVLLILFYSADCYDKEILFFKKESGHIKEYLQAASWIKEDSKGVSGGIKIMALGTALAYLTDASLIALPAADEYQKIVSFALLMNVNYVILDREEIDREIGRGVYLPLMKGLLANPHLRMVYQDQDHRHPLVILKVLI